MKAWIVRVSHNRVAVGIFSCRKRHLPILVDEFVDPSACEYRRLPPGGFQFGGSVDLSNFTDGDEQAGDAAFNDINLTECWRSQAMSSDDEALTDWMDLGVVTRMHL